MRKRFARTIGVAVGIWLTIAANGSRPAAQSVIIGGTTHQLTVAPAVQFDPSISGDLVVWTGSETGNDDIYYCFLDACSVVPSVVDSGDQRLHDVSGTIVVYTDQRAAPEVVRAFDAATNNDLGIVSLDHSRNPRIDGALVAYEVGEFDDTDIWVTDLATGTMLPVATSSAVEIRPVVSGTRIAFERRAALDAPADIVVYDLNTGIESLITSNGDYQRPDFDGNTLVYDGVTNAGDLDIFVHNLATGITRQVGGPGDQFNPHVSGDVVSFDTVIAADDRDVMLYHIPSGVIHPVATNRSTPGDSKNDFLNDISGNRIVYASNVGGSFDIWMYEFDIQLPEIEVAPLAHDFGDVTLGTSATTIVTLSNVGNLPLTISDVALQGAGSPAFSIGAAATLIAPGGTLDIPVSFAPTSAGTAHASLTITSDDLDEAVVRVALSGHGVVLPEPPLQQIAELLAFFDNSVANGSLSGNGPGNSAAGRLNALRNMIDAAGDLIQDGSIAKACGQLRAAYLRTDGVPQPPEFVTGTAAAELALRISRVREALGCS
jgi:beta propeller repeat protein